RGRGRGARLPRRRHRDPAGAVLRAPLRPGRCAGRVAGSHRRDHRAHGPHAGPHGRRGRFGQEPERPVQHRAVRRGVGGPGTRRVRELPRAREPEPRGAQPAADPGARRRPDRVPAHRAGEGEPALGARPDHRAADRAGGAALAHDFRLLQRHRKVPRLKMLAFAFRIPRRWHAWLLVTCLLAPVAALGQEGFVVRDMRVEGLQRISEGTVFNYLPINVGDTVDAQRIQEAIRALYAQGLFDDIEMRRDGSTLVIAVKERPSIEQFTIEGNKDIKTEDLMQSLRNVGLARGKTFDRSVLDNVQQFLREQYYDRGKYAVQIDADVEERPNNTVRIKINIKEGERARIRQVNIVGNHSFPEEEIREGFTLDTANWLSWLRQDDRYSKEALSGDLETLRSFYM